LCEEDPEAAKFVGKDRWTALHHACNRRCPREDVVEALIRAYPDALLLEVEKGWYPLHFACRFKAPKEVVRLLVHLYPDKGKKAVQKLDRQGRTALYYAVRYDAPAGVVGILLDVDPSVVLEEDQNADSPLGLVWDQWAEKLEGKRTLHRIYGASSTEENLEDQARRVAKRLQTQAKVLERWNIVNIFLMAAFGFPVDDGKKSVDDGEEEEEDSLLSAVTTIDGRKWRALHATAAIKCHSSLFQLACALHPEQASEYDEEDLRGPGHITGGWNSSKHLSALHLAASSQAHGESGRAVLQKLLAMNPSAVEAKDGKGASPLHRLAENPAKSHWLHDGIADIYEAYPEALRIPDCDGKLPLHRAASAIVAQGEATNETIVGRSVLCNLLNLHPDASAHSDNFGQLPLHIAVQNSSTWDIQLQSLLDQFPQAVRSRTGIKLGNLLPLHMAASNPSADVSMIQKLVESHPRAASQASRDGKFPLHYACETGLSWESVKLVHEANPDAVRQPEQNSCRLNALQMAASCKRADKELLENLLRLYPDAASATDSNGRYALHLACIAGKSWDGGLSDLFDAYPEALGKADSMGLLPFYIACFRYSSVPEEGAYGKMGDKANKHHRRNSSSMFTELIQKEQAMEAEDARQVEILFQLLKADPTVL
jgi:ankyrin repeat protein